MSRVVDTKSRVECCDPFYSPRGDEERRASAVRSSMSRNSSTKESKRSRNRSEKKGSRKGSSKSAASSNSRLMQTALIAVPPTVADPIRNPNNKASRAQAPWRFEKLYALFVAGALDWTMKAVMWKAAQRMAARGASRMDAEDIVYGAYQVPQLDFWSNEQPISPVLQQEALRARKSAWSC